MATGIRSSRAKSKSVMISSSLSLDVEVHDLEGVLLDEGPPRFDGVAHQHGEQLVGLGRVLDPDLEEAAALRVHRRGPELLGVHLAEALVALDREPVTGALVHPADEIVHRLERLLDRLELEVERRDVELLEMLVEVEQLRVLVGAYEVVAELDRPVAAVLV